MASNNKKKKDSLIECKSCLLYVTRDEFVLEMYSDIGVSLSLCNTNYTEFHLALVKFDDYTHSAVPTRQKDFVQHPSVH